MMQQRLFLTRQMITSGICLSLLALQASRLKSRTSTAIWQPSAEGFGELILVKAKNVSTFCCFPPGLHSVWLCEGCLTTRWIKSVAWWTQNNSECLKGSCPCLVSLSILSYERYTAVLRPSQVDVSDFRKTWLCVGGSWLYSGPCCRSWVGAAPDRRAPVPRAPSSGTSGPPPASRMCCVSSSSACCCLSCSWSTLMDESWWQSGVWVTSYSPVAQGCKVWMVWICVWCNVKKKMYSQM